MKARKLKNENNSESHIRFRVRLMQSYVHKGLNFNSLNELTNYDSRKNNQNFDPIFILKAAFFPPGSPVHNLLYTHIVPKPQGCPRNPYHPRPPHNRLGR